MLGKPDSVFLRQEEGGEAVWSMYSMGLMGLCHFPSVNDLAVCANSNPWVVFWSRALQTYS